ALAIDALDAAVERRRENDRSEDRLAQQLHALGIDRTRLAEALDAETAHTKQLTASNGEIAQRLEAAMSSVQSVLAVNEWRMASSNSLINGRQFRLACEDGQEDHLEKLAEDLDARIAELRKKFGEIGDTRLTVMAALTIADDLSEAGRRSGRLKEELTAWQDARVATADRAKEASAAVVNAFNSAAERLENITKKLNATLSHGVALG